MSFSFIDKKKSCITIVTEFFFAEKQWEKKHLIFTNFDGGLVLVANVLRVSSIYSSHNGSAENQ